MVAAYCRQVAGLVEVHALLRWSGYGRVSKQDATQPQRRNVLLISSSCPIATGTVSNYQPTMKTPTLAVDWNGRRAETMLSEQRSLGNVGLQKRIGRGGMALGSLD